MTPNSNPDPEVQAALAYVLRDEDAFIQQFMWIRDKKTNSSIPFKFNRPQQLFTQRTAGKRFFYVLKARKEGLSTRIIAKFLYRCATEKNHHAVLLTHTDEAAQKMMMERIKPMIRDCKYSLEAKPQKDFIYFPRTGSRYYVGTAGSKTFGRGDDITMYHMSELCFYDSPEVLTGVEEACVDNAWGCIETTANAVNFGKKLWEDSVAGRSRYTPIFLPWYCSPEYSIPGAALDLITEDETKLMEAFGLTQPQIAWRRSKLRDMSQPELFPQEYPSTPEEAFIKSGRMVFDWISLLRQENHCCEPRTFGYLKDLGERVEVVPGEPKHLKVWDNPIPGHVYIIGADVAEGLEDGAYSAGIVLDLSVGAQAAEWHGHIDPDLFGDELVKLGRYYNNAMLAPETWPGPGAVTMKRILDLRYRNYYQNPERERAGWETNVRTKQEAVLAFSSATRDKELIIKSKELISEMRSFVYIVKKSLEAQQKVGSSHMGMGPTVGCFSDRVMGAVIAWRVGSELQSGYRPARVKDVAAGGGAGLGGYSSSMPGVSVPRWRGPVMGVRNS